MRALLAAAVAALVLTACQDPAGVGLGLIDEEQLDPNAVLVPLTDLTTVDDSTVAIGIAQANPTGALSQPRLLVGAVADPRFGDATAVAYLDFLRGNVNSSAEAADVTAAWLVLNRAYAYGDTTTALPLELRQIQGTWEASRDYPADTLFNVGPVLSTTTVVVGDTLPRFDLPQSWVRANAATLIASDFTEAFEGFALQVPAGYAPAPGVVWGFNTFDAFGSALRVVVGEDTLAYRLSEVFSSITTAAPTAAPTDVLPARAASKAAVRFEADLATLGTAALAQARLRLPLVEGLAEEGPFVRPISSRSFVFGIRGSGTSRTRTLLGEVTLDDGSLTTTEPLLLTQTLQAVLSGSAAPFDHYEVVPDPTRASLDVLPVLLPAATGATPRLTLTLVGGQ